MNQSYNQNLFSKTSLTLRYRLFRVLVRIIASKSFKNEKSQTIFVVWLSILAAFSKNVNKLLVNVGKY